MGWADNYIDHLKRGETVQFRPRGGSMRGRIESGQLVTVEPVDSTTLQLDDIVLCSVGGAQYLHIVKAIRDGQFQIGNNLGGINGWVTARAVYGRLIRVES